MDEDEVTKAHKETMEEGTRKQREYNTHKRIYESLTEASGNPMKLKEIIGAKTVADVYRTLDKLTIRREFHDALTRAGITFEFLIEGIKREAIGGDKSMDRLKAYEMLLKTLGLDKYDDTTSAATSSWEERLLKAIEGHEGALEENVTPSNVKLTNYSVITPTVPNSVKASKEASEDMSNSFSGFPKRKQLKGWA